MTLYLRSSRCIFKSNLAYGTRYYMSSYGHPDCQQKPPNPFFDPGFEQSIWGSRPRCFFGRKHTVTMACGLGTGPELMEVVRRVFRCANAPIDFEILEMGKDSNDEDLDNLIYSVERNGVAIKGSIDTPLEPTELTTKSFRLKRALDLYVYLTEIKSYQALMEKTRLKSYVDVVLITLNAEDAFAMLEHDNGKGIENLRITTNYNTRRLAEFAFDYAVKNKRRKVTLVFNKGYMNWAEGTIVEAVSEVAARYPEMAFLKQSMPSFTYEMKNLSFNGDVIVTAPLYGGLIKNILFGMMQGTGLYCAQNLGSRYAVFEAAARNRGMKLVGKDLANPVAMLDCGVKLLRYLGHHECAAKIQNSVQLTLNNDRVHTTDMLGDATTSALVANIERRIRETMPDGYRGEKIQLADDLEES